MVKRVFLIWVCLLVLGAGFVSAELSVEKIDKGSVIISELNNPAVYEFIITNTGPEDNIEIYNLLGISMSPKGYFDIPSGKSKVEVKLYPRESIRSQEGTYIFEYQINGQKSGIFEDNIRIEIVSLENLFDLTAENLHPNDEEAVIMVRNRYNTNVENITLNFESSFFDFEREVSLGPFEEINISMEFNKEKTSKLRAGPYIFEAEVDVDGAEAVYDGVIQYLEKEGTSIDEELKGFLVREKKITKKNEGNVPVTAEIETSKDVLSRLFTTYSKEPLSSERSGLMVGYVWKEDLEPGEAYSIVSRTNYTLPFFVLVLLGVIGFLVRTYTFNVLTPKKTVSFVKTRGGELALKVKISVKAGKDLNGIEVTDRIPTMTKLYNKFPRRPDKIDTRTRTLTWNIPRLNSGEERIFSYIIYSKVRIVGKFELPSALINFEKDGEKESVQSNRAFFMTDTAEDVD